MFCAHVLNSLQKTTVAGGDYPRGLLACEEGCQRRLTVVLGEGIKTRFCFLSINL